MRAREEWETELASCFRSAEELCAEGFIRPDEVSAYGPLLQRYKFLLPRYYAALIDRGDPLCPIRRQAIPDLRELEENQGWDGDPLQDLRHRPAPRLTHRYAGRALLHLTKNCSMYCRYCFRKDLLNEQSEEFFKGALDPSLRYLQERPDLQELILSGGDPLLCSDRNLERTLGEIAKIPHIERLRIHTRVPVTFPSRVTERLAKLLAHTRLPVVIVTHFNHPKEVTAPSRRACDRLRQEGMWLLNQSVLLHGVNDVTSALAELSRRLFEIRVLPYYLHHPDRAQGTRHFDISMERGLEIMEELRSVLPGYLVPRYVVDEVGSPYKQDVAMVVKQSSTPTSSPAR